MRRVISALHLDWGSVEELLERVGDLGLDGVEVSLSRRYSRPHLTAADITGLAALRHRHALLLTAHIWDDPVASPPKEAAASLMHWLGVCRETGIQGLVMHGGSYVPRVEGLGRLRRVLSAVADALASAGVTLYVENHYPYDYHDGHELLSEGWEFVEVFSDLPGALRICFDSGHGHMLGDVPGLIQSMAPWLGYVHLADNEGVDDDHLGFGYGTVDWNNVFSCLSAIRFDGIACVEFPVRRDQAPFRACMAALDQWFNHAQKQD